VRVLCTASCLLRVMLCSSPCQVSEQIGDGRSGTSCRVAWKCMQTAGKNDPIVSSKEVPLEPGEEPAKKKPRPKTSPGGAAAGGASGAAGPAVSAGSPPAGGASAPGDLGHDSDSSDDGPGRLGAVKRS
jgi:hypothetical protein